ncbi:DUF3775 domain-containing protein [Sporosarcina aquimarina]|uniref:DUF3775 domain-containing protein n=1 Tax=Sporosarcina aquimarina TaxID=114975 RepID=UPI001C8E03B6|nr:DUF3775 domain-containing protein [Sporosarcina aquimarina]MBY0221623.1 DUF3775 domain-containing protein [Sporosarcina aquimarina]
MFLSPKRKDALMSVISLAKERREVMAEEGIATLSAEAIQDYMDSEEYKKERQLNSAIYEYLMQLPIEEVKFIQTVMYIGRDESLEKNTSAEILFNEVYTSLHWATKKIEAKQIVEKMPLDEYLSRGMELMAGSLNNI